METEEKEQPSLVNQTLWQRLKVRPKDIGSLLLYILIGGYIIYTLGLNIYNNYHSHQDIKQAESRINDLKYEKAKLSSLLVYYNTKSYQEIELRRRLLLKRPGETVVALKGGEPLTIKEETASTEPSRPPWQEWYDFYFKRQ